jgi:hypothetical protein
LEEEKKEIKNFRFTLRYIRHQPVMSEIFFSFFFMGSLSEGDYKVQVVVAKLEQASALEGGQSCTHRGKRLRERNDR